MNNNNSVPEADFDLEVEQDDENNAYFNDLANLALDNSTTGSNAQKIRSKNSNKRIIKERIEMQLEKIRQKKEFNYLYDD